MDSDTPKSITGIRIRTVNIIMILISCILYIMLISLAFHVSHQYEEVHNSMDDYITCQESHRLLMEGSACLTNQVQLYTVTLDPQYMENYFTEANITRRRENALEQLGQYHGHDEAYDFLAKALETSNHLMEQEIYAMKLTAVSQGCPEDSLPEELQAVDLKAEDLAGTPEEMIETARGIIFSDSYLQAKEEISQNIADSMARLYDLTHHRMLYNASGLERTIFHQQILISILFVENVITFILIILLIIKPLQIYIQCIKEEKLMKITGSYEFKYLALTYNDIYEVNEANEAMLRYRAEHDPLTGIINRGAFDQLKKIFQAKSISIALLIIDVDKFKQVNDGYGHETGDQVLKKVANLLEAAFRTSDYPARIGGDEFAVILTNIAEDQRPLIECKIAEINNTLLHPEDGLPRVSLSVGGAFSEDGFTDNLYNHADLALYDVKEHGRCGCRFYTEDLSRKDT